MKERNKMSTYQELQYVIEQERRRNIFLERITKNIESFLQRYEKTIKDIENNQLDYYIPNEYISAKNEVDNIRRHLENDPEYARELSQNLGSWIGGLPQQARMIKKELLQKEEENQRRIEKEQKELDEKLHNVLNEQMNRLTDPLVRDYAYYELRDVVEKYSKEGVTHDNFNELERKIAIESNLIIEVATVKAKEYKKLLIRNTKQEQLQEMLNIQKESLKQVKVENQDKLKAIMTSIDEIEKDIKSDFEDKSILDSLNEISNSIEEAQVDEEYRRHTVKSMLKSLVAAGFNPSSPRMVGNEVIITAQKIGGEKFESWIKKDGSLKYHFNGYKVNENLQSCYGIKLDVTKTVWKNPDRIQKNAKPISELYKKES